MTCALAWSIGIGRLSGTAETEAIDVPLKRGTSGVIEIASAGSATSPGGAPTVPHAEVEWHEAQSVVPMFGCVSDGTGSTAYAAPAA